MTVCLWCDTRGGHNDECPRRACRGCGQTVGYGAWSDIDGEPWHDECAAKDHAAGIAERGTW